MRALHRVPGEVVAEPVALRGPPARRIDLLAGIGGVELADGPAYRHKALSI